MIRRARLLAVVATLLGGALGLISSTQTWVHVALTDGAAADIAVAGADAIPVLAPLSLAVLALGLALSIVGLALRYAFGALSVLAGAALVWLSLSVLLGPPQSAVAPAVTETTGITGAAVAGLIADTAVTAWPLVALVGFVLLTAAGVFVLVTAARWQRGGRKYEAARAARRAATGPLDAIDSWDDLSRGDDPTTGGAAR